MNFTEGNWGKGQPLTGSTKGFIEMLVGWNKEIFGNIKRIKESLRWRLDGIHRKLSQQALTNLLKLERKLKLL